MERTSVATPPTDLHAFVTQKLTRIFGDKRATELLAQVLLDHGIAHVATVEDLVVVANALQERGGFEATAGAMLAVHAQMLRVAR